jgi:Transposase, Mutator family
VSPETGCFESPRFWWGASVIVMEFLDGIGGEVVEVLVRAPAPRAQTARHRWARHPSAARPHRRRGHLVVLVFGDEPDHRLWAGRARPQRKSPLRSRSHWPKQFLGSNAGLSATTITRLTSQWQDEAKAFGERELVALADGYRESTESWADLLRSCLRRGMAAPVLAVGDGALGFWKAVREVFPATREQRCWFHKQANVLAALPKSAHPGALAAIKEIYNAEDIDKAQIAIKAFEIDYGAKYPKAVAKIVDDAECSCNSTSTRPSTGSTCAPPTRSNPPSPPCGCAPRPPRAPDREPRELRWPTS